MTPNDSFAKTTLVLETGVNLDFLVAKLSQVFSKNNPSFAKIVLASPPGQKSKIIPKLSSFSKKFEVVEIQSLRHDLPPFMTTPFLAYLPSNAPYCVPPIEDLDTGDKAAFFLRPWIPPVTMGENECARLVYMAYGWVSTPALFQHLGMESSLTLSDLEQVSQKTGFYFPYLSTPASVFPAKGEVSSKAATGLSSKSRVLALVPHFNCEPWLGQSLDSLTRQTRPLDAIVVMDDASPHPPLEIVRKFPAVTLLRSPENGGPYRLVQSVIGQTQFDAYMLQDADDWSSLDRLEALLREAERTGAEWIGTQELMYFEGVIHALRYPVDINRAPQAAIRQPFCYPSSLFTRDLIMRLGGFASGLRFSGDFELLTRAVFAGKVGNLDRYGYFRRIRKDSLVTSEKTGLGSPARKEIHAQIEAKKMENLVRVSQGLAPLLEPLKTAPPVLFEHLAGPPLEKS
jgi:hypothetical protein